VPQQATFVSKLFTDYELQTPFCRLPTADRRLAQLPVL